MTSFTNVSAPQEPYRIAGGAQPRAHGTATAVAKRRMSCQAAAFRGSLKFSLSGLSQDERRGTSWFSPRF
jgi:hypothetical protein